MNAIKSTPINSPNNAVIITGNISYDRSVYSYLHAWDIFDKASVPIYWLAGRHDNEGILQTIFSISQNVRKLSKLSTPYWDLLAVDNHNWRCKKAMFDKGVLLDLVKQITTSTQNKKQIAIVMPEHPHQDVAAIIDDPSIDLFFNILRKFPAVKLVMCGYASNVSSIPYQEKFIEVCPRGSCHNQQERGDIELVCGYKEYIFTKEGYQAQDIFEAQ